MGTLGDIATKEELVVSLAALRAAAIYDIFGQVCLQRFAKECVDGRVDPESLVTEMPEGQLTFGAFMRGLDAIGQTAAVETKRNANRSLTRNLLKEMFRITQSYCEASSQDTLLKAQPWYQFTRLLVNSMSHSFRLEFRDNDRKKLPLTYDTETLDSSMDGKPISMPLRVGLQLCDELLNFAQHNLTR